MSNSKIVSSIDAQKNKKKVHSTGGFRWSIGSIIVFIVFLIYAASLLGALLWAFMNSLKGKYEYLENVVALPKDWLFSNYIKAFQVLEINDSNAFTMLFNSLWLSLARPAINILTATMASYVMSKYKFPGRDLIWGIILTIMVLPIYGNGAAGLLLYKNLGFYDSPLILLASVTGLGGNMMIISAFDGVSKSYMEAAFVEGAGHFRVFWQIMVPQITGLLSALYIMAFIGNWNDYMTSLMYLPSYLTLSTGLYVFQEFNARTLDVPLLFAGALLCMVPTTLLFITFQDKFMNLSFGGGIKG